MKLLKTIARLAFGVVAYSSTLSAQGSSYSLSLDTVVYQPLVSEVVVTSDSSWQNSQFSVAVPFVFNSIYGPVQSLTLHPNGFITLSNTSSYAMVCFNGFGYYPDSIGIHSGKVSYVIAGTAPNRILKIQFANLSRVQKSAADFLSYQVWFYENAGKVECHVGPNAFGNAELFELLGMIDVSRANADQGQLITGTPGSFSLSTVVAEAELSYIEQLPVSGTVFILTPTL